MRHEDERLDEVAPREGADGGGKGAEVVADEGVDGAVAEGVDEGDDVAHHGEGREAVRRERVIARQLLLLRGCSAIRAGRV